jgi:hypothetical protein
MQHRIFALFCITFLHRLPLSRACWTALRLAVDTLPATSANKRGRSCAVLRYLVSSRLHVDQDLPVRRRRSTRPAKSAISMKDNSMWTGESRAKDGRQKRTVASSRLIYRVATGRADYKTELSPGTNRSVEDGCTQGDTMYMVFPIPGARACNRGHTNSTCQTTLPAKADESGLARFHSGNISFDTFSVDGRKHVLGTR